MDEQVVRRYLSDALCNALFHLPGPMRLGDILAALPPSARMSNSLATELLAADPRFAACETRWDLAHRQGLGERPLGGALILILQAYGRPVPEPLLLSELCLSKQGDPEAFRELLEKLLHGNREIACIGGHYHLTRWLANTAASEDQRLLYLNGLEHDEVFQKAQKKLLAATIRGRTPLDTAEAALKTYGQPLDNRALGLVLWRHHEERFDATETLQAMLSDPRFLVLSGPQWLGVTQARTLAKAADKLRGQPDEPVISGDLMAILQSAPAQRLRLSEEESQATLRLAIQSRFPVSINEVLTEVLKLRSKQRNFVAAAHAVEELLNNDLRLIRLQRGHYLSRQSVPDWVRNVPPSLVPVTLSLGPREINHDVLLPVDELKNDLAERVLAPFYEDHGETEVAVGDETPDFMQIAIPYHHYRLGTMKLRLCDRRLFNVPGPLTALTVHSPDGTAFPIWVNTETRLLYGLLPWYQNWLHPNGSLLAFRRLADHPGEYTLAYNEETDPGTYIGRDRFSQLLELKERLLRRRVFLLEIITEVLGNAEKGLPFDQLWAQVNIIRRVTRLQVASILSHYPQFNIMGGRWGL